MNERKYKITRRKREGERERERVKNFEIVSLWNLFSLKRKKENKWKINEIFKQRTNELSSSSKKHEENWREWEIICGSSKS